ncbi:MAG: DNA mismatch repair endonuclease MutL [Candidatus Omnitrophica bacterium]|nr:DNA mismatch repair protein MutL [bacterium]NUN96686.1 DNA mismatch repair endonuclease MutL [Candidatus Omnitrophota bacterium]
MSRIKILPEVVASQIAAGEVVQRPASVVKELIENSLDAGAGRIRLEVDKGGNSKIRVVDDGCGMSREELPIALRRHATSKIEAEADLVAIRTFGFRGEALAAISSVSKVELISREQGAREGSRLLAVGGEVTALEPVGCPPGTSVTISDLFFNTPARRKFLKSPSTEMDRVSEIFLRTAIAHPSLHLEISHNSKRARNLTAVPSTLDRLVQIFGRDLVEELLPVEFANDRIQVTGFTSRPTTHRNSAADIYFHVNRRFVRDRLLLRALSEAYRASLPQRRYPVTVLFLELAPESVDVNVHPSKEEIRFRDERLVWNCLYTAIREALSGVTLPAQGPVPEFQTASQSRELAESFPPFAEPPREKVIPPEPSLSVPKSAPWTPPAGAENQRALPTSTPIQDMEGAPIEWSRQAPELEPLERIETLNRAPLSKGGTQPSLTPARPSPLRAPAWRAVAQVFNSYIIAESEEAMSVFDQHALHERLRFEKLRTEYEARTVTRQRLLFPVTVEIPAHRKGNLLESLDLFSAVGLDLEHFGDTTFVVRAVPEGVGLADVAGLVEDALNDLAEQGNIAPLPDRAEKVLARMACRSAIKAGEALSLEQMQDLLDQYTDTPALATCPHGRPPIWKITRREMDKWFERG